MISHKTLGYQLTDDCIEQCAQCIERSDATTLIEQFYQEQRGVGGRRTTGPVYSILGVLTIGLALMIIGRVPSLAEILRVLSALPEHQLVRIGMNPARRPRSTDYPSFWGWLTRRLEPLDQGIDLPARRVTNKEHRAQLAARTAAQQAASELARDRLLIVVNRIIAASIEDPAPQGGRGDVVIDESIVLLAGADKGLGSRDDKRRGAAYSGKFFARDLADNSVTDGEKVRRVGKLGVGIGITAVSRLGPPDDLYAIAPTITAVALHHPTSASIDGARTALEMHQLNGLDQRLGRRARQPYLTVDMAYNQKKGFNDMCLDLGYSPVVRYPVSWNTVFASESPEHIVDGQAAGPVQLAGDFYCPVAQGLAGKWKLVRKTVDLKDEKDGFDQHDRRLEKLLPLLMGTNSRPYRKRARTGRPKNGETVEDQWVRGDLVCPAVQGRVRCPLKPASLSVNDPVIPTLNPTWSAERYRCCSKSQVTVALSDKQWKRATWGLTPGSWEHATYFEAARSATEQRFSSLKSAHLAGFEHLKWSPRREPMISLLIALWVAATNVSIQESHRNGRTRPSSIKKRKNQIQEDLGRSPVRIPPRT